MIQICKIKGFENIRDIYYIDENGIVISYGNYGSKILGEKKILKQYIKTGGYKNVALMDNNSKVKYIRVHRIVAAAYCNNEFDKPYVNHIDENRTNNNYKNLEWVTPKENNLHSLIKKIYMYDLTGKLIKKYDYTRLVIEDGFNQGHVCAVARGEERQHKGYIFSYEPLNKNDIVQRLSKTYFRKSRSE